jgi:hypothetical protein
MKREPSVWKKSMSADPSGISAYITVGADDAPYRTMAIAWSSYEVKGLHIFNHLGREVALEDVAHVCETMVGHREAKPGDTVFCLECLEYLVNWLFPECGKTDAEVNASVAFTVTLGFCFFLFFTLQIQPPSCSLALH